MPWGIRPTGLYSLQKVTTLTSGTTFTPQSGDRALYVECIGGGGAGGGGVTGAGATSAGSGGGAGAYSAVWLTTIKASYAYSLGAAGTPGAAGNNPGGNGGDTTFDSPSVCTAKGGIGGLGGGVAGSTVLFVAGSAGGASASGVGDLLVDGGAGAISQRASATAANSGQGGESYFGAGGLELVGQGAGNAGLGFGGGGAGGVSLNGGASVAGGAGAAGVIRVWEFG